jgi:hypothetical protein
MNFIIKGLEGEYININVVSYSYPDSSDYWDGNWISCLVKAQIPGFVVSFPTYLRTSEIVSFYSDLVQLYDFTKDIASLVGMESNIDLQVQMDKLGKLTWKANLTYPTGHGSTLEFEFESEQSYLINLMDELKSIVEEFPIKGQ